MLNRVAVSLEVIFLLTRYRITNSDRFCRYDENLIDFFPQNVYIIDFVVAYYEVNKLYKLKIYYIVSNSIMI